VGQRHNQVDKLPKAVERAKKRGSKELAVALQVHDRVRRLTSPITSSSRAAVQFCSLQLYVERLFPRFSEQDAL
jgi:hypothetical protein